MHNEEASSLSPSTAKTNMFTQSLIDTSESLTNCILAHISGIFLYTATIVHSTYLLLCFTEQMRFVPTLLATFGHTFASLDSAVNTIGVPYRWATFFRLGYIL